jgi:methylmalonyl-CoA/ethylmalonyl-CoA epimerase
MTTDQVDTRRVLSTALVTAVDHVGIAVPDLDAAIAWYHDHLGMIVLHEEVNDDQGIREAMLSVRGAAVGSAQVQLMAPIDDSSAIAKFLDKRGPGIQQLAYRVSDLDALSERMREQGLPPRHSELADQLHPPQGRRRRPDRVSRTGHRFRLRTLTPQLHFLVGPRVARLAQHGVCQCRRSSTATSPKSASHTTT